MAPWIAPLGSEPVTREKDGQLHMVRNVLVLLVLQGGLDMSTSTSFKSANGNDGNRLVPLGTGTCLAPDNSSYGTFQFGYIASATLARATVLHGTASIRSGRSHINIAILVHISRVSLPVLIFAEHGKSWSDWGCCKLRGLALTCIPGAQHPCSFSLGGYTPNFLLDNSISSTYKPLPWDPQ